MHLVLSNFKAQHFKNIASCRLAFSKGFNCFTGKNGSGKTNLLDAIYYLSIGKSNFNVKDQQLILNNEDFFRLEAYYNNGEKAELLKIEMAYHENKTKKISSNNELIKRIKKHLGTLPVLLIAPDDIELIKGYSNYRRRTIDKVLCQTNANYLEQLSQYQQILQQRNYYLKNCKRQPDFTLLESYNYKLAPAGTTVFTLRKQFLNDIKANYQSIYNEIAGNTEVAAFQYNSDLLENDYANLLKNTLRDDALMQRTSTGIHKDDVQFLINEAPAKNFGSQGQQKNVLIAFKLACALYMQKQQQQAPILLLDDIFDKLDSLRVAALLQLLQKEEFGQIFITDTDMDRMQFVLNGVNSDKKFFTVDAGAVKEF